jgi:hypothetical protein
VEQVKKLSANSKKQKKTLTPEQDAVLIGDGFATFKR